ncbi:unnamed protein product [Discula destructiva]
MPRISPPALRAAYRLSPHAATLLPACRDLPSALNELRWIREHVATQSKAHESSAAALTDELRVASLCRRRGRGEPLQYVLGTVPFGDLEILCRPGVLIPRPEPEAYTTHLAHLLTTNSLPRIPQPHKRLSVLDLCTGTGCIALLLHALLAPSIPALSVHGVDISPHAVRLARRNMRHNTLSSQTLLAFSKGDIFSSDWLHAHQQHGHCVDVLVCNPPYVSPWGFAHQTARSVRNYEPKLAQVPVATLAAKYPGAQGRLLADVFYARLLDVGVQTGARVMLFEVGDMAQALRVVEMALGHCGLRARGSVEVEVWRDWPDAAPLEDEETSKVSQVDEENREVRIKGSGHGRSVFIQCN